MSLICIISQLISPIAYYKCIAFHGRILKVDTKKCMLRVIAHCGPKEIGESNQKAIKDSIQAQPPLFIIPGFTRKDTLTETPISITDEFIE